MGRDKSGKAVEVLLRHGVNSNPKGLQDGCTPLHHAVSKGNPAAVRHLVRYPACDVNAKVCISGATIIPNWFKYLVHSYTVCLLFLSNIALVK